MGLKGDTAQLKRIARKVRDAFGPDGMRGLSRNLAEETVELIREGFDRQGDPYGRGWAPLKARSGKILQDTGLLRRFKPTHVTVRGFTVSSGATYGPFHQSGTSRMPARKMVPDGGMPARWMQRLERIAKGYLKERLQ